MGILVILRILPYVRLRSLPSLGWKWIPGYLLVSIILTYQHLLMLWAVINQIGSLESESLKVRLSIHLRRESAFWRSWLNGVWWSLRDVKVAARTCWYKGRRIRLACWCLRRLIGAILCLQVHLLVPAHQLSLDHIILVTVHINSRDTRWRCIFVLDLLHVRIIALILNPDLALLFFVLDATQLASLVSEPKILKARNLYRILFPRSIDIESILVTRLIYIIEGLMMIVTEKGGIFILIRIYYCVFN